MTSLPEKYLEHISSLRRYSPRTRQIYSGVLEEFCGFCQVSDDDGLLSRITPGTVRDYQVHLLDAKGECARTVNLHLSVLSGFCKYLVNENLLGSNPVRSVPRPRQDRNLPVFLRDESVREYFRKTACDAGAESLDFLKSLQPSDKTARELYSRRLERMVISMLLNTGIRRSELISLDVSSVDFGRKTLKVHGKGDKMREIPLLPALCEELLLYLQSADVMFGETCDPATPLLRTPEGNRLYPVFVDRTVKAGLGQVESISGRKSPHVLRHTLATELLNDDADLNSIKELLGHSSLAATQIYTHNSAQRLKNVFNNAHPRAKSGGKNGD